jgi:phosphohistidine phosphatase
MKSLYLIRHAKSDWSNPFFSDFDRGLNKRGAKDVLLMGKALSSKGIYPDLIVSSSALRAKTTAIEIARQINYPLDLIQYEASLYACKVQTMISIIQDISQSVNTLFVFGHNPELTQCANMICGANIENIPTCGVAAMRLHQDNWKNIGLISAKLLFLDTPKQHH